MQQLMNAAGLTQQPMQQPVQQPSNVQQSAQTLKILRQNDVSAANDRQAAYLLAELDRKFAVTNV